MTRRQVSKLFGWALALTVASSAPSHAAPLTVNVNVNGTWLLLDDTLTAGQYYTGAGTVYDTINFPTPGTGTSDINEATRYSWTSATPVRLDLTDWSTIGDGFKVWVDSFNPATPLATYTGTQWYNIPGCDTVSQNDGSGAGCHYYFDPTIDAGDIDSFYADPYTAHGFLNFGAGTHNLVIQAFQLPSYYNGATDLITGPFPDGTAAFRLTAQQVPVPEPASLLLLGSGLIGGALQLRRRRRKQS